MNFGEHISILHVEDDDIDVESLRRAFRRNEIKNRVYVAHDGVEALELLRSPSAMQPSPSIIVTDINMPRMNGLELIAELRRDPALCTRLVYVLSTSSHPSDISSAYQAGVAGYLVKPDSMDALVSIVQGLFTSWQNCLFPDVIDRAA